MKGNLLLALLFSIACSLQLFATRHFENIAEKVIICGVCKNVEDCLPTTIESIEKLGRSFEDYRVFIYEDNSTDSTPLKLQEWAESNPHVQVTCEVISEEEIRKVCRSFCWDKTPFRTERIARARNFVLQQAMQPQYDDYKYLIMCDMDIPLPWDTMGIISSIFEEEEWDALFANGMGNNGVYYDRYAFRDSKFPFGPELLEDWWKTLSRSAFKIPRHAPLYPVFSAFGGLGVYRREAIRGCEYAGVVTNDLEAMVRELIAGPEVNQEKVRDYYTRDNPLLNIVQLSDDGDAIKWILNSGSYEFPACCEHVTFHAAMWVRGHRRLFINPKMVVIYP
jgi:glycosyltransferase involved in cell wall biosynthesis